MPGAFLRHLKMLEDDFGSHPNIGIATKLLRTFDYIEVHRSSIAQELDGNRDLFIRTVVHLPVDYFPLSIMRRDVTEQANQLLDAQMCQLDKCFEQLAAIPDPELRKLVTNSFLFRLKGDDVDEMNHRLTSAFKYLESYQAEGCVSLDELMQQFESAYDGNLHLQAAFEFFTDKVEYRHPVKAADGVIKPLTWEMIKENLKNSHREAPIDQDWLHYYRHVEQPVSKTQKNGWYFFNFRSSKAAKQYLSYIRSISAELADQIKPAMVIADINTRRYQFKLTTQQLYQFNKILIRHDLVGPPLSQRSPFAQKDMLIKTVRWDKDCFIEEFTDGILPIPSQDKIKQKLRKGLHRKYIVDASGVHKRTEKPSPYGISDQEELKRKKDERSPAQSTSLVTTDADIAVFGHASARREKLVGFAFDPEDALFRRLLIYDTGTYTRPDEFKDKKNAERYYSEKVKSRNPVLFGDREKFKKAISDGKLNEAVARIRWLEDLEDDTQGFISSEIRICSDTFEARCIAQYYARVVRRKLKKDESYLVPIVFYLPDDPEKHHTYYT